MEMTENAGKGLLETLAYNTGCMYLSDLHQPERGLRIRNALQSLRPEQYSLREWNDAICYITGMKAFFRSQKQAAVFLKTYWDI